MATFWIDGASGDDGTGDGSFALPYATVGKGITQAAAEADGSTLTINVMNTATYTMPASELDVDIDGHPNSTLTIQGVSDASATPAMVSVQAPSTGDCTFAYIRSVSSTTVQGFAVDFSPSVASATGQDFIKYRDSDGGPIIVQYCTFTGSTTTTAPAGPRNIIDVVSTGRNDNGEIRYCYIRNMSGPSIDQTGSTTSKIDVHHNVVLWDTTTTMTSLITLSIGASASHDRRFYANTVYVNVDNTVSGQLTAAFISHSAATGDNGRCDFYDNVFWIETSHSSSPKIVNIIDTAETAGSSFSSGTRDYNVWYTGPSVASGDVTEFFDGLPWPTSQPANDTVSYEQADTVLFNDPSSSFTWTDINSSGYSFSIDKDLRLVAEKTSGQAGGLPGALPSASTDYTLTITSSVSSPRVNESVTLTVTASNSGTDATTLDISAAIPSGMTYVSSTPSAGTYTSSTGIWSIGTLTSGSSETLTLVATVDSDQGGNSIAVPVSISSADPAAGAPTSDDSDSVTLTVISESLDNPDSLARVPYIDVLPLTQPVLELDLNVRLRTKRNREEEVYLRSDVEQELWAESRQLRLTLATNTTQALNMGGIQRGSYLMVEADEPVQVSVAGTAVFYPQSKAVVLAEGDFEQLAVKNPSTTSAANVLVAVID